jgi:hypothetical protein
MRIATMLSLCGPQKLKPLDGLMEIARRQRDIFLPSFQMFKMTELDYFYEIIDDVVEKKDTELMAKWYALEEDDIDYWIVDRIDDYGMADGGLRDFLIDILLTKRVVNRLYDYIQKNCAPGTD